MNNTVRKTYRSVRNFIKKHRVAIAVTTTAGTCLYVNRVALKQHDDFLKEKGLYNEFYYPELND